MISIRVAIVSQDRELRSMLTSVLGSEVMVVSASDPDRVCRLASDGTLDAVLLDADLQCSHGGGYDEAPFAELANSGRPVIILADDETGGKPLNLWNGAPSVMSGSLPWSVNSEPCCGMC